MARTLRGLLLLGSATLALGFSQVMAGDDPLVAPEGTQAAKGKVLVLPPSIDEAPAGSAIVLPPPGQEALLGEPKIVATDAKIAGEGAIGEGTQVTAAQMAALKGEEEAEGDASEGAQGPTAMQRYQLAQADSNPKAVNPASSDYSRSESLGDSPAADWKWQIGLGAAFGTIDVGQQHYLATYERPPATCLGLQQICAASMGGGGHHYLNPDYLDLHGVTVDDDDDIVIPHISVKLNISDWVEPLAMFGRAQTTTSWLALNVGGFDARFRSHQDYFSPDEYESLVILGVGQKVYETGEFGDSDYIHNYKLRHNTFAHDLKYDADYEARFGSLLYGETYDYGDYQLSPFGGFGYARRELRQLFSTDLRKCDEQQWENCSFDGTENSSYKGFAEYDTQVDVDTYSFILGMQMNVPLDNNNRWAIDGYAKGSYDINKARGLDRLTYCKEPRRGDWSCASGESWEGDKWSPIHVQEARLRHTDEAFGYGAGVGLNFNVTRNVNLRVGLDYNHNESYPIIVRDGVNASHIDFEDEEVVAGSIKATFTLN
jgi:opacity protein-like surface antigen